jgi:hypothetical protein
MTCWYLSFGINILPTEIPTKQPDVTDKGRTSTDVGGSVYRCKTSTIVEVSGRWRMFTDVGGWSVWWARQDSNLQPDRYERPALTIELQAPPRRPRGTRGRQRCGHRLQRRLRSGNGGLNPPKHRRIPPLCATSRSRRRPVCRIRPASSVSECRRSRRAAPPAWGP